MFNINEKKSKSLLPDSCPVTGLKILKKDEWHYHGKTYSVSVGLINGNIIISKPIGREQVEDGKFILDTFHDIVKNHIEPGADYAFIIDASDFDGQAKESREPFIDNLLKLKRLKCMVVYEASLAVKTGAIIASKVFIHNFSMHIEKNYEDAIKRAFDELGFELPFKKQHSLKHCEHSGKIVTEKTDYNKLKVGKKYNVTFSKVGTNILLVEPEGNIRTASMDQYYVYRNQFIDEHFQRNEKIVEVRDYSKTSGLPTRATWKTQVKNLKSEENRLLAFILNNPSFTTKLAMKIGAKLNKRNYPIFMSDTLKTALTKASEIVEENKLTNNRLTQISYRDKEEWSRTFKTCKIQGRILNNEAIYLYGEGELKAEDVPGIMEVERILIEDIWQTTKHYYRITDYSGVTGTTVKSRINYAKGLSRLFKEFCHPQATIVIGASKSIETAVLMLNHVTNLNSIFVNTPQEALEKLDEIKRNSSSIKNIKQKSPKKIKQKPKRKKRDYQQEKFINSEISKVLLHLGNINWENYSDQEQQESGQDNYDTSDPSFKDLYRSIDVVKSDIERILKDRDENKQELEDANTKLIDTHKELLRSAHETGMADAANRAKTEFLANISHELRTPMHAILSFARFARKKIGKVDNKIIEEYLETILSTGDNLMNLLNDILDYSELEDSGMRYSPSEFQIEDLITEEISRYRLQCFEKKISIHFNNLNQLPKVDADKSKIMQVISNILSNAIKFTPEFGNIKIEAEQVKSTILVSVIDTGIGIPDEETNHIFDKFVQSTHTKTGAGGTGLGLSISQKIIDDHKGRICARNNKSVGSTFQFSIPIINRIDSSKLYNTKSKAA